MEPTTDLNASGPTERGSRAVVVVGACVAFLVPWATQFGGRAWWGSTVLAIDAWLLMGVSGGVLIIVGGRVRRTGTALLAGDALGIVMFLISFFVVVLFSYGGEGGG